MNKPVALEPANRDLYDLSLLTGDDGCITDNVGDILLDGLPDLLPVTYRVLDSPSGKPPVLLFNGHYSLPITLLS
jgi:hypothetical protein